MKVCVCVRACVCVWLCVCGGGGGCKHRAPPCLQRSPPAHPPTHPPTLPACLQVNALAPMRLIRSLAPGMADKGEGE